MYKNEYVNKFKHLHVVAYCYLDVCPLKEKNSGTHSHFIDMNLKHILKIHSKAWLIPLNQKLKGILLLAVLLNHLDCYSPSRKIVEMSGCTG